MRILYLPNQYSQQRQREKRRWIYPVHLAMEAEWHRRNGDDVVWDYDTKMLEYFYAFIRDRPDIKVVKEPEGIDFLKLPPPDRIFTNAFDKKYQNNGNFKYHPGTYIQVASGCHWGKCEFCVEKKNEWRVRDIENVQQEIWNCYNLGFKEIFDDSGTFPIGDWLDGFCRLVLPPVELGCNMRMVDVDYGAMKQAGFRMLLFGLESANQNTLNIINKGTREDDVKYIVKASRYGLDCHVAVMFGYPWEMDDDAMRTLKLVHWLLKKGYARTAQASFYNPPDGKNNPSQRKYVKKLYSVAYSPQFWMNQLKKIHDVDDIKYIWRGIKEALWNR